MKAYIITLAALLAGCSGPIRQDNAIATFPVPNPDTDCQVRVGTYTVSGGGLLAQGSMHQQVTTIIGADNCQGLPVSVPAWQQGVIGEGG